jgi:hypothetical protein
VVLGNVCRFLPFITLYLPFHCSCICWLYYCNFSLCPLTYLLVLCSPLVVDWWLSDRLQHLSISIPFVWIIITAFFFVFWNADFVLFLDNLLEYSSILVLLAVQKMLLLFMTLLHLLLMYNFCLFMWWVVNVRLLFWWLCLSCIPYSFLVY